MSRDTLHFRRGQELIVQKQISLTETESPISNQIAVVAEGATVQVVDGTAVGNRIKVISKGRVGWVQIRSKGTESNFGFFTTS